MRIIYLIVSLLLYSQAALTQQTCADVFRKDKDENTQDLSYLQEIYHNLLKTESDLAGESLRAQLESELQKVSQQTGLKAEELMELLVTDGVHLKLEVEKRRSKKEFKESQEVELKVIEPVFVKDQFPFSLEGIAISRFKVSKNFLLIEDEISNRVILYDLISRQVVGEYKTDLSRPIAIKNFLDGRFAILETLSGDTGIIIYDFLNKRVVYNKNENPLYMDSNSPYQTIFSWVENSATVVNLFTGEHKFLGLTPRIDDSRFKESAFYLHQGKGKDKLTLYNRLMREVAHWDVPGLSHAAYDAKHNRIVSVDKKGIFRSFDVSRKEESVLQQSSKPVKSLKEPVWTFADDPNVFALQGGRTFVVDLNQSTIEVFEKTTGVLLGGDGKLYTVKNSDGTRYVQLDKTNYYMVTTKDEAYILDISQDMVIKRFDDMRGPHLYMSGTDGHFVVSYKSSYELVIKELGQR